MSLLTIEHALVAGSGGTLGYFLTKIEVWIKAAWAAFKAKVAAKVAAGEAAVKKAV